MGRRMKKEGREERGPKAHSKKSDVGAPTIEVLLSGLSMNENLEKAVTLSQVVLGQGSFRALYREQKAMVYTIFLGKQGKSVYTIGPERRIP